jgi:hypothetical protein
MSGQGLLAILAILVAVLTWALALGGVATGQEYILKGLYFFAWYPLILFLDGWLFRRQGRSWLLSRPRAFLKMSFWSVTAWLMFEALNLALRNWRYEGLMTPWWLRWPGYALAFATVLPAVLLTAELLAALGAWQGVRGRPRQLPSWEPLSLLLGTVLLTLPLILPQYAFSLVWVALIFLLDPFGELWGGRSLIRDFLEGERQEHLCLLCAGLLCGLWWECWNYPATAKWVYALPVLNFWKVFEMPIFGYLGFLPFALECAVIYNFFDALENRLTPRQRHWAYLLHILFWLLTFAAIDTWTAVSFR